LVVLEVAFKVVELWVVFYHEAWPLFVVIGPVPNEQLLRFLNEEGAQTLSLVISEFSFVDIPITVEHISHAILPIVFPVAVIDVSPTGIHSSSSHLYLVLNLATVHTPICVDEFPSTALSPIDELSLENDPSLKAIARPSLVGKSPLPMHPIVLPLPFIHTPIYHDHCAIPALVQVPDTCELFLSHRTDHLSLPFLLVVSEEPHINALSHRKFIIALMDHGAFA